MRVYQIQDEDDTRIVEAPSFVDAIVIWRRAMAVENAGTPPEDFTPCSVTEINDRPVIRS